MNSLTIKQEKRGRGRPRKTAEPTQNVMNEDTRKPKKRRRSRKGSSGVGSNTEVTQSSKASKEAKSSVESASANEDTTRVSINQPEQQLIEPIILERDQPQAMRSEDSADTFVPSQDGAHTFVPFEEEARVLKADV
jgi:hypothetical protein